RSLFSPQTHRLIKQYTDSLLKHPRYTNARYFLLFDRKSINTTLVFLQRLLPEERIVFYSNQLDRRVCWPISEDGRNVPHCSATLFDVVNLAYVLGYKTIVLVGVDLYDRRYFWLKETESRSEELKRGATFADVHQTAKPVLENMTRWQEYLNDRGVDLRVYNPKSLLAGSLPVYHLP
ncbi:MAG: hypothetical protein Q7T25_05435, partial [Sideroxyarcus sp.]|nr:hypothetical protein [Sideroxyarcus sp.]